MRRRILAPLVLVLAVACCGGEPTGTATPADQSITVTSPAFDAGEPIPDRYTCAGAGISPPLRWSGIPRNAAGVAVVVTDPDAPGGTFTHWVVYGLATKLSGLDAGMLPPQAKQATNSTGEVGYTPPCPPSGTHTYRFTVYTLGQPLGLPDGASLQRTTRAIRQHAVAKGTLVGTVTA